MQHVNHLVPSPMQTLHPHDLAILVSISSLLRSKLLEIAIQLSQIEFNEKHSLHFTFQSGIFASAYK